MPFHIERWGLSTDAYNGEIDERLPNWMLQRPNIIRSQLKAEYPVGGEVELNLNVYPPGSGKILLNTVVPEEYPWNGIYFDGVPVTLTALPANGSNFNFWKSTNSFEIDFNTSIVRNYSSDDRITAYFETFESPVELTAYPNPAEDEITISFVLSEIDDIGLQLVSLDGKKVRTIEPQTLNAGRNLFNMSTVGLRSGIYVLNLRSSEVNESFKIFVK